MKTSKIFLKHQNKIKHIKFKINDSILSSQLKNLFINTSKIINCIKILPYYFPTFKFVYVKLHFIIFQRRHTIA